MNNNNGCDGKGNRITFNFIFAGESALSEPYPVDSAHPGLSSSNLVLTVPDIHGWSLSQLLAANPTGYVAMVRFSGRVQNKGGGTPPYGTLISIGTQSHPSDSWCGPTRGGSTDNAGNFYADVPAPPNGHTDCVTQGNVAPALEVVANPPQNTTGSYKNLALGQQDFEVHADLPTTWGLVWPLPALNGDFTTGPQDCPPPRICGSVSNDNPGASLPAPSGPDQTPPPDQNPPAPAPGGDQGGDEGVALDENPYAPPNLVDMEFIANNEGGQRRDGYFPQGSLSKSGATVATGIDIGQLSRASIQALPISDDLKNKLLPYAGLKGQAAKDYLAAHPFRITQDQADALDAAVQPRILNTLIDNFNGASSTQFTDLPAEAQTVIADMAYQYGPGLSTATPKFWADVTSGDWAAAESELQYFADEFQNRRLPEAALLQQGIDRGAFPSQ